MATTRRQSNFDDIGLSWLFDDRSDTHSPLEHNRAGNALVSGR
jgi:hypothetical protein